MTQPAGARPAPALRVHPAHLPRFRDRSAVLAANGPGPRGLPDHPGAAAGVLPINVNVDAGRQVTKSQMLCLAADAATVQRTCGLVERAFHHRWLYDRD